MAFCQYCGKEMTGFWSGGTHCSFRCALYDAWYFFMIFGGLFLFMGLLFDIKLILFAVLHLFGVEVPVNDRVPTTPEFFSALGFFSIPAIVLTLFGFFTVRMSLKAKKDKKIFKRGFRKNETEE